MNSEPIRSYDGANNNRHHASWGKAGVPLLAIVPPVTAAKTSVSINPRTISNIVCREEIPTLNRQGLSMCTLAWGQLLYSELIDIAVDQVDPLMIPIPTNDRYSPEGSLIYQPVKKHPVHDDSATEQPGSNLSSYIDGTFIYGSGYRQNQTMRRLDGTGKLKYNDDLRSPAPGSPVFRLDHMANPLLQTLRCVFIREHNRYCDRIAPAFNAGSEQDEWIFQKARRYITALLQIITYEEFLPALLGAEGLSSYRGYDDSVDATLSNLFVAAGMPFIFSMQVDPVRIDKPCEEFYLSDFYSRTDLLPTLGTDPLLRGMVRQPVREIDPYIVESMRSYHCPHPIDSADEVLIDMAATIILQGRDYRLPSYNACREAFYLSPKKRFSEISQSRGLQKKLISAYAGDIDRIDPWIGGLAEDFIAGSNLGELLTAIIRDQFERCRDGDRFWYENDPALVRDLNENGTTLARLKQLRLSDIIRQNTPIKTLHGNVFYTAFQDSGT